MPQFSGVQHEGKLMIMISHQTADTIAVLCLALGMSFSPFAVALGQYSVAFFMACTILQLFGLWIMPPTWRGRA